MLGCPAAVYVGTKRVLLPRNGRISLARTTFPLCEHGWTRLNVYPAGHRKLNSWTAINDDPAILHPYLFVPPTSFVSLRLFKADELVTESFLFLPFFSSPTISPPISQHQFFDFWGFSEGRKEGRKRRLTFLLNLFLFTKYASIYSFVFFFVFLIRRREESNFISRFLLNFFIEQSRGFKLNRTIK